MKVQLKADLSLLMITMFWGTSYLLTKIGLNGIDAFNLTALRFVIAFILSGVVFYKHIVGTDFTTIKYAGILAFILFGVFVSMTFGVKYTSASNAGFLISLTVIFIPILTFLFLKRKPEKKVVFGVGLALCGISLLTLNSRLQINYGDLLCILCALLYAAHIIVTGILTQRVDSVTLGILQLGFVGLFSAIFSVLLESPKLPAAAGSWLAVLALSVFCTAVAFIVQTIAQQYTNSAHAGLIFSLEPVFSAIFAFLFIGERLTPKGYFGAALLLLSVLIAEIDL